MRVFPVVDTMFRISGYIVLLFILCVCSTLVFIGLITFASLRSGIADNVDNFRTDTGRVTRQELSPSPASLRSRTFHPAQVSNKMSELGKRLFLQAADSTGPGKENGENSYLIVIWKHGPFLERRHITRFSQTKFSPWRNCTAKNCKLSYRHADIAKADAVVFHLHLSQSAFDFPMRENLDQRWIFLTDESPVHTFRNGNQELSDYNGIFNWSMSYRSDSDVPVPYGRTVPAPKHQTLITTNSSKFPTIISSNKTKLVAIMGSNCASRNNRWTYVKILKTILGDNLDIFGRCLGGNVTACPGHFTKDCAALNSYKFYLAFENSNCREYLTEKVFWHAYEKWAVPVIMGAPRTDCERLLPPRSFLHVADFESPSALANYLLYLDRNPDKYLEFHEWRKYYRVLNEHGYFGSASRHYCRICEALRYNSHRAKVYEDLNSFWSEKRDCVT